MRGEGRKGNGAFGWGGRFPVPAGPVRVVAWRCPPPKPTREGPETALRVPGGGKRSAGGSPQKPILLCKDQPLPGARRRLGQRHTPTAFTLGTGPQFMKVKICSAPSRAEMEANAASDEGVHFQSYPFDFLEFLNHQRFEPMEAYNHEHAKAVAALPCPQPQYDYTQPPAAAPPAHFDRVPAAVGTSKPKAEGPSSSSTASASSANVQVKKAEPGGPAPPPPPPQQQQQQQQQPPYSTPAVVPATGQPLFDSTAAAAAAAAAYNTPQWGIVDLSGHQHLFSSLKRGQAPPPTASTVAADSQVGKDDKNYFRRLKYFIDRRFPCGVCQKSFKQSSHLVQHMLVHTGERPYECTTCGRTYNHISSLIRHRRCHKDTEDATAAANAAAANVAAANAAAAAAAAVAAANTAAAPGGEGASQPPTQSSNPQVVPAPTGGGTTASALSAAIAQAEGPFTCSLCWKVFKKPSHLHQHQIIHTGEKPFSCSVCQKSFNRRESLKRHIRTHSDLLRVQCGVCGKEFRDASYLLKHQATHAPPGTLPPRPEYKCDICGKGYVAPQNLLRHRQLQHEGAQLPKDGTNPLSYLPPGAYLLPQDPQATSSDGDTKPTSYGLLGAHPLLVGTAAGKNFCCGICGRGFGRRETLKRHERIHTGEKPHQCAVCGKRFRESFHLSKHHVVHTRERPYKCEICGKVFGYPQSLTRHKQIHRLQLPCSLPPMGPSLTPMGPSLPPPPEGLTYGCSDCGERFPDLFHVMSHKEVHVAEKPYPCDVCGKCFGFIENLMWHKLVHQAAPERLMPPDETAAAVAPLENGLASGDNVTSFEDHHPTLPSGERFSCSICGQTFKHFLGLVTHKYVHLVRRTLACSVCGQSFAGAYDLLLHRRTHLQKRHFSCPVCGKRFWEAALLMRHQRCHTEERPYRCAVCGRGFLRSWYLRQHKVVHTGERAYKCALCNKRFAQSSSLAEHQRLHVVARPQRCPTCGKTFRYRSNLLEHQRVHLGEKVYRCDRCSKSFFYLSSILRHQRSHDAKRELRCGACLKLFKDPKYFSKHLQAHQGGRPFKCSTCGEAFSNTYGLKKHRHIHKMERYAAMGAHKEQP